MKRDDLIAYMTDAMRARTAHRAITVDRTADLLSNGTLVQMAAERLKYELVHAVAEKEIDCIKPHTDYARPDIVIYSASLLVVSPQEIISMIHRAYDQGYGRGKGFERKRTTNKIVRGIKA